MSAKLISLLGLGEPEHLILIVIVILLLFGGKKIPEMMRGLGSGVREFNNAKNDVNNTAKTSSQKNAQQDAITDLEHETVNN